MKKILLLQLTLALCINCFAQKDFRSGSVVNLENETTYGEIDYKSDYLNSQGCTFRKDGQVFQYSPYDIKEYRIDNEKFYIAKNITLEGKEIQCFLELLVDGIVDLYRLSKNNINYYFIERDGQLVVIDLRKEIERKEDGKLTYKRNDCKGKLKYIFRDAPELHEKINRTNFDYKPLIALTKEYHNIVCNDYSCIDYSKTTERKRVHEFRLNYAPLQMTMMDKSISGFSSQIGYTAVFNSLESFRVWHWFRSGTRSL